MPDAISTKQAAFEAGVHGAQIFDAIRRGALQVRRANGRILVMRVSFDAWKRRLEIRRNLRKEELRELRGGS